VNFLHPAFHNAKHIWPLGYQATCLAATPASDDAEVEHVCQIVAAADGSGPRFRYPPPLPTLHAEMYVAFPPPVP